MKKPIPDYNFKVQLSKIKGGFTIVKLLGTFNDVIEKVKPEKNTEKKDE